MASKEIVSKQNPRQDVPVKREAEHPFLSLQREMNRLFDNFFRGLDPDPWQAWERGLQAYNPRVDVADDAKALRVTAELPGMDEKDVEISLAQDTLTLRGHKQQESEEKSKNHYRMERSYGEFQRVIPLPTGVDADKIEAVFKKGVLTVTLPKISDVHREIRKIAVKSQ